MPRSAGGVKDGLSVVKIGVLLERRGVVVPYRTLHRFCAERCGYGRTAAMVRVADGEPGVECQLDFGYLGLLFDPVTGRQRKAHALIFTACYSRHMFVWLSFTQNLAGAMKARVSPHPGRQAWQMRGEMPAAHVVQPRNRCSARGA